MITPVDNANGQNALPSLWTWVDDRVIERISEIGLCAFAVYMTIAKFAGEDRTCFPSVATIAGIVGKTPRMVRYTLKRLKSAGLIRITRTARANRYTLLQLPPSNTGEASCTGEAGFTRTPETEFRPGVKQVSALPLKPVSQEVEPCEVEPEEKKEPATPSTDGSKKRAKRYTPEDLGVAKEIWAAVDGLDVGDKEPNLDDWANVVRLTRKSDGRTHDEIRSLFEWANRHEFWAANIRSPRKLRKQWATLTAQRKQEKSKKVKSNGKPSTTGGGQMYDPSRLSDTGPLDALK